MYLYMYLYMYRASQKKLSFRMFQQDISKH